MAKTVFHVVQVSRGKWVVNSEEGERVSEHFDRKSDAVSYGRRKSRDVVRGPGKRNSALIIHRRDGSIQKEHGYGIEPFPPGAKRKKGTSSTGPRRK